VDAADLARVLAAKRRGEEHVRASGLGYTIIRPGPLVDEPGGYKALVFDQVRRPGGTVRCTLFVVLGCLGHRRLCLCLYETS
jgi:uncharacterized protein YbjT (DUF2867 family)